jgi:hypothetical protein
MAQWAFSTHVGPFTFTRLPRPTLQQRPGLVALLAWPTVELLRLMLWLAKVIIVAAVLLTALAVGWVSTWRTARTLRKPPHR